MRLAGRSGGGRKMTIFVEVHCFPSTVGLYRNLAYLLFIVFDCVAIVSLLSAELLFVSFMYMMISDFHVIGFDAVRNHC